ncbi:MAG TPA: hypothetical protein VHD83_09970 [Puia sp.]|nr:hypothetical protein [Puia sp.]
MIKYTSDGQIFVTYDDRSADHFEPILSEAVRLEFGLGPFDEQLTKQVLLFAYNWLASTFHRIVTEIDDANFVFFIFFNHESSFELTKRISLGENLEAIEGISPQELALNRRILRLSLEQTCEVNYTYQAPVSKDKKQEYIRILEDLLYIGKEIYYIADCLAENRMTPNSILLSFNTTGRLNIERNHHFEDVIPLLMEHFFDPAYREGVFNTSPVHELRATLLDCMGIDYDFAGGLIFEIKKIHSGNEHQTVEPGILPKNLVNHGVDAQNAENFYDGLTLSRRNKLSVADSVYKVSSLNRHMFRPILIINYNGEDRALVGRNKWGESIVAMGTNGFQWRKAPEEWLRNKCFRTFLDRIFAEHDRLLEDEVQKLLNELKIPFARNILSFRTAQGNHTRIDVEDIGEMDFVFIDPIQGKIVVADCKYNRARYEMVGYSTDYKNFVEEYEPKLKRKIAWLEANRPLVQSDLELRYPGAIPDISTYPIIGMFIINTPTYYMLNGAIPTMTIYSLKEFIEHDYTYPSIEIKRKTATGGIVTQKINHPYFTVQ